MNTEFTANESPKVKPPEDIPGIGTVTYVGSVGVLAALAGGFVAGFFTFTAVAAHNGMMRMGDREGAPAVVPAIIVFLIASVITYTPFKAVCTMISLQGEILSELRKK